MASILQRSTCFSRGFHDQQDGWQAQALCISFVFFPTDQHRYARLDVTVHEEIPNHSAAQNAEQNESHFLC